MTLLDNNNNNSHDCKKREVWQFIPTIQYGHDYCYCCCPTMSSIIVQYYYIFSIIIDIVSSSFQMLLDGYGYWVITIFHHHWYYYYCPLLLDVCTAQQPGFHSQRSWVHSLGCRQAEGLAECPVCFRALCRCLRTLAVQL